jgi:hypothetical protein
VVREIIHAFFICVARERSALTSLDAELELMLRTASLNEDVVDVFRKRLVSFGVPSARSVELVQTQHRPGGTLVFTRPELVEFDPQGLEPGEFPLEEGALSGYVRIEVEVPGEDDGVLLSMMGDDEVHELM